MTINCHCTTFVTVRPLSLYDLCHCTTFVTLSLYARGLCSCRALYLLEHSITNHYNIACDLMPYISRHGHVTLTSIGLLCKLLYYSFLNACAHYPESTDHHMHNIVCLSHKPKYHAAIVTITEWLPALILSSHIIVTTLLTNSGRLVWMVVTKKSLSYYREELHPTTVTTTLESILESLHYTMHVVTIITAVQSYSSSMEPL